MRPKEDTMTTAELSYRTINSGLVERLLPPRTPKRPRKGVVRREVLSKRMISAIISTLFTNGNKESAETLCLYNENGQYLGGYSEDGMRFTLGKIRLPSPAPARKRSHAHR